jgi:transketolase
MAAAMNGMALHGGIIPFSGTFLVFADYCRPAIRLAALMGQRVIHVMTHDSIGLGEDGPTHQPFEHLAALRAIPNLLVLRPCDAVETVRGWQIAIEHARPEACSLTRQNLPQLRLGHDQHNRSARGLRDRAGGGPADVSIFASGSGGCDCRCGPQIPGRAGRQSPRRRSAELETVPRAGRRQRQAVIGNAPVRLRGRGRRTPGLG